MIDKNARVQQIVKPIEGTVIGRRFNDDASEMEYEIDYIGADNEQHYRWFRESEVKVLGTQAPTASPAPEAVAAADVSAATVS